MPLPFRAVVIPVVAGALLAQDPDLDTKDTVPGGAPAIAPPALPQGMSVEQMWPPPTADDWAKPVLVPFERTWGDAVAVAQETNKPILVCINMDGEIASEHYAGVHYRNPDWAERFADYVCVIASVYRHTPRDHDVDGHRILCPRFGSVTCGEHIAIEPLLHEKFMGGQRISPRHIMVELDGHEVFDVFHAWDNQSILTTIRSGIEERQAQPRTVVRGDRPIVDRVASRAREDREATEQAYRQGDRALRETLLQQALQHPEAAPLALLRQAIQGLDPDLAKLARQALVKVDSPTAVDLLAEALRAPVGDDEREQLVAALERQRDASPAARLLTTVHRGLTVTSKVVDVGGWGEQIAKGQVYQPADDAALEQRADAREAAVAAAPDSADAQLDLAESSLELALDPATADRYWGGSKDRYGKLLLVDARRRAAAARAHGSTDWRVDAIQALCTYYLDSPEQSYAQALQAAAAMPAEPDCFVAVWTLALFAEARIDAIWQALRAKTDWPREWMTDVSSAYSVLARHPLGNAGHAVVHYDFLDSLRASRRAGQVLDAALTRFPASPRLHDRLRKRLLRDEGLAGLVAYYDKLLDAHVGDAAVTWFAAYAKVVEAEYHRRDKRPDAALAAYRAAVARFDRALQLDAGQAASVDHHVALALAGQARLAIEAGDLGGALALCLAGIERCPTATPVVDGLEISPVQTARLLESRLLEAGDEAAVQRLRAVLDSLPAELLSPPAYEQQADPGNGGRAARRGRRR